MTQLGQFSDVTPICVCTHLHTSTHMCTHPHTCAHIHTHVHTSTHMCTHPHTCAHTLICTHTNTSTQCTHTCTHAHTHTHTHIHTHTCTHTHTHKHTHTHTHTVEETLKQGHVPPRQSVYIERRDTIERLRQSLRTLGKREGWLVVHGMAGFGKTVLAAEAVRDSALLREAFPGGVNWLTVGQMADARGRLDESKLLTRMQNLIVRLDEKGQQSSSSSRPGDLESARDYLQKVISEQHPRSLLILDDVWTSDVARHFAVRCRTMVTTRNAAIADAVQTPSVDKVSISEGFSDEEARQMLSLWSGRDLESLPPAADSIVRYCRGSPMALALIGANLRKGARDVRWKQIADKLEASHGAVDIKLLQPEWNYQHPTLKASIDLSVEGLSSELRSLFDLLVVFDYDTLVPLETLATLWDLDTLDADIKMTGALFFFLFCVVFAKG